MLRRGARTAAEADTNVFEDGGRVSGAHRGSAGHCRPCCVRDGVCVAGAATAAADARALPCLADAVAPPQLPADNHRVDPIGNGKTTRGEAAEVDAEHTTDEGPVDALVRSTEFAELGAGEAVGAQERIGDEGEVHAAVKQAGGPVLKAAGASGGVVDTRLTRTAAVLWWLRNGALSLLLLVNDFHGYAG